MKASYIKLIAPVGGPMLLAGNVLALLAGAMLFGGIAQGAISTLDITENSSTSLTWVLNGVSHTISTDSAAGEFWDIHVFGSVIGGNPVQWLEPDGTGNVNVVEPINNSLYVSSDLSPSPTSTIANGDTDRTHFFLNGAELDVTFHDNGDIVVPEPSTLFAGALLLLPFGISALRGLQRKFSFFGPSLH